MGFQTGDGIPDVGGVPGMVMMGYKTGNDGVTGRDGVTTLMSHQSEILHSLIFLNIY